MRSAQIGSESPKPSVISLFSGAGGLDLGLERAGFRILCCVENDPDARNTIAANRPNWVLSVPGDIFRITPEELLQQAGVRPGELDLLAGGPPCQPFSISSHWTNGGPKGLQDPRANTIDAYLKFVEYSLPRAILLENVEGISRNINGTKSGTQYISEALGNINDRNATNYQLEVFKCNAADYGVPQIRERIFMVASRDGSKFLPPPATFGPSGREPYNTAWDSIGDIDVESWDPGLSPSGKWADLMCSIPEGKNYLWHTSRGGGLPLFGWRRKYWSFLLKLSKDRPSWTIQASPGPSAGPFHWRNRLLSIRELCRLQTFPEDYIVHGDRRVAQRQIGNAVPSALGELFGLEIKAQFLGIEVPNRTLSLIPLKNKHSPPPSSISAVSKKYLVLMGEHPDHPGTGKGPGKRHSEQAVESK